MKTRRLAATYPLVSSLAGCSRPPPPPTLGCANQLYDQCGGLTFSGLACCPTDAECHVENEYYHQCRPSSTVKPPPPPTQAQPPPPLPDPCSLLTGRQDVRQTKNKWCPQLNVNQAGDGGCDSWYTKSMKGTRLCLPPRSGSSLCRVTSLYDCPDPSPFSPPPPLPPISCDLSGCVGCSGSSCSVCADEKYAECCINAPGNTKASCCAQHPLAASRPVCIAAPPPPPPSPAAPLGCSQLAHRQDARKERRPKKWCGQLTVDDTGDAGCAGWYTASRKGKRLCEPPTKDGSTQCLVGDLFSCPDESHECLAMATR